MISVIITTKKEPKTLTKAIQTILDENLEDYKLLVVGPDKETEKIAEEFSKQYPEIKYLKDKGVGKPAALNLAFNNTEGEILVLTDGDVYIEKGAIKKLLKHFEDEKVGAVSGHPVPINSRKNIFGYWSHFLTKAADFVRKKKNRRGEYLVCSGYLYAIRREVICNSEEKADILKIPAETFVEDSIISERIWQKGYKIIYQPEAKVYVRYPDNFKDWLKQKVRATGGYIQRLEIKDQNSRKAKNKMRSLFREVADGLKLFFIYPKTFKEFWWTILLYLARLYLWLMIFWQIKILKKPFSEVWQRIESTK